MSISTEPVETRFVTPLNGTNPKARNERAVLRGLVQWSLDLWPQASILRAADFTHYRDAFTAIRGLLLAFLKDGRRPDFNPESLSNPAVGIDAELVGSLFEACHPESGHEALFGLLRRSPTLNELEVIGKTAYRCQRILEMNSGILIESLRTFAGKSAAELWALADQPIQWLVDGVFSCDQPTIFGAKQKSLKTTLLTDLAVSMASGFPWLGRFEIPQRRRVLFITGEASEKAAIRKVKRAAESRNLQCQDFTDNLRIEAMAFPTLPSLQDCLSIQSSVETHEIDAVLLDPLYMGLQGLNTANLTEVGPAMRQFMEHCRPANVIIAHHVKKSASFDDAPNLEDLSQAGIAEFAGNYWLMGRMAEYTGDGHHQLAIRYGGRDEQFGLLKLDFDERAWTAAFTDLMDHREDLKQRKDTERANKHLDLIKGHLNRHSGQASLAKLAEAAGTKPDREFFQRLIDELTASQQYERCEIKGRNNKSCDGLRAKRQISTDSVL